MNKKHWNTVTLDGSIPDGELRQMIDESYELVVQGMTRADQARLQTRRVGRMMARALDKILVIDVEATCWEGDPPAGQTSEIIEIGLCVLDVASGERSAPRAIMVKPQRSTLSEYCIQLTTITPEMLADG
jgi:DNA polymerase III epsilon subunit-like protein